PRGDRCRPPDRRGDSSACGAAAYGRPARGIGVALDCSRRRGFNAGMTPQDAYAALIRESKEISLLGSAGSVLHWDEETHLPAKGSAHRANQASLIARLAHEQFTSPRVGEMLAAAESSDLVGDAESDAGANVREL